MAKRNTPESNLRRVDPQFRVTLPPDVRKVLQLGKDDLVGFQVTDDGRVWIRKARIEWE